MYSKFRKRLWHWKDSKYMLFGFKINIIWFIAHTKKKNGLKGNVGDDVIYFVPVLHRRVFVIVGSQNNDKNNENDIY